MRIGCATFLRFTNSELSHPTFKHPLVVQHFRNLPIPLCSIDRRGRIARRSRCETEHGCVRHPDGVYFNSVHEQSWSPRLPAECASTLPEAQSIRPCGVGC